MSDALQKLIEVDLDARNFGFEWPNVTMILDKINSEAEEIREAINSDESNSRIQEEIGDLLHVVISLCLFLGLDVDETLQGACDKLHTRIKALKNITQQQGLNTLKGKTIEVKLQLWEKAKSFDQT